MKKTNLRRPSSKDQKKTDFREVIAQFVRVLMLLGADKAEIVDSVQKFGDTVALPKSVKVVSGSPVRWAYVMRRWADDPRFLNSDGRPRDLSFSGKSNSFSQLVKLELPDESPVLCRDILLAAESIVRLPSGKLRWRYRDVLLRYRSGSSKRGSTETIFVDEFLNHVKSLLSCSEVNLTRKISNPGLFQRAVSGFSLKPEDVAEFQRVLDRHGMAFLETIDDWLAHRSQKSVATQDSGLISPMVGLFMATEVVPISTSAVKSKKK